MVKTSYYGQKIKKVSYKYEFLKKELELESKNYKKLKRVWNFFLISKKRI